MDVKEVLSTLESHGNDARRKHNAKAGAPDNQFGTPMGEIRALAKKIKSDHTLALRLWKTGNVEAQLLATLIMNPQELSEAEVDGLVRSVAFAYVADWLLGYVVSKHPASETLRRKWMEDKDPWAARAGWGLTASRVANGAEGLDPDNLLDRIEEDMPKASPHVQWTMNTTLATIGIHNAACRARAIAIGEKIGLYRDWPVSKGCTPPFVPVWINEMVRRSK